MLRVPDTVLVIVDIQERLAAVIHERERVVETARKLVEGARVLGIPILHTEQYPKGLGRTVPEIAALLDAPPIEKTSFGCCGEPAFINALDAAGRKDVLLAGMETHVCVYQTAAQLLDRECRVHVVTDAVGSRTHFNREAGIAKMHDAGAQLTTVEMALFELLEVAQGDAFKQIIKIVK